MSKKVKLNRPVHDLEGKDIPGSNVGKTAAQVLAGETKGDALKLLSWAMKLHNGEELDLDPSDLQTFKSIINNSESITVLAKAQILHSL